jgi:hypothetical protein
VMLTTGSILPTSVSATYQVPTGVTREIFVAMVLPALGALGTLMFSCMMVMSATSVMVTSAAGTLVLGTLSAAIETVSEPGALLLVICAERGDKSSPQVFNGTA